MVVSSPLFIVQMVLAQQAGFTASLSAFSEEWRTEVGSGKAVVALLVSVVKVTLVLLVSLETPKVLSVI